MTTEKTTPPLLELADARVQRDGREILHVARLELREGERVAILGPNGAGKSTLIRLLTRDAHPLWAPEPPIKVLGRPLPDLFEVREVLGIVSNALQDEFAADITVRDAVLSGFFGAVGLRQGHSPSSAQRIIAEELLHRLGIAPLAERHMNTLSTGEARRALIARALTRDPRALVLDEPCDGLDPAATHQLLEGVVRPLSREGRTVVLVTHHVDDVVPEIERIVLLKAGHIVGDGPKESLLTAETLGGLYGFDARVEERDGWYRLWW